VGSGAATSRRAARFLTHDLLERGVSNRLTCPVYLSGNIVEPTESGSTITIWDGSTKRVDAAAITGIDSDGVAYYDYTPASTISYSENWRIEWSLVYDSANEPFRNDAQLVRHPLVPVLTDADLYRRHRGLNPAAKASLSTLETYAEFREEAWIELQNRLIREGNRCNLVLNPSELREPHLYLTLALIFEDFRTSLNNEVYGDRAKDYMARFKDAYKAMRLRYASADEEENGGSQERRSPEPTVWLC